MSFHYHVLVDGEVVRVYKKAFAALHQITESKIYHLTQQIQNVTTTPHPSYREKHNRTDFHLSKFNLLLTISTCSQLNHLTARVAKIPQDCISVVRFLLQRCTFCIVIGVIHGILSQIQSDPIVRVL